MRSCIEEQSTSLPPARPRGPDGGEGSAPRSDGAYDAARAAPGALGSVADAAGGFGRWEALAKAAAAMVASAAWREEGRRDCGGVVGDSRDDNHSDGADDL